MTTAPGTEPVDVHRLVQALERADAGRPRLTWYGPDGTGERVELSSKVLRLWVAKTANLLVDELDVAPGDRVAVALPPHWRTVVWVLAVWSAGASPVPEAPDAAVTVSDDASLLTGAPGPVAVDLAPLATRFTGTLPVTALDYAAQVSGHADAFVPSGPTDVACRALDGGARVLSAARVSHAVGDVLAPLAGHGSLLVLHPGRTDVDHLLVVEQATRA